MAVRPFIVVLLWMASAPLWLVGAPLWMVGAPLGTASAQTAVAGSPGAENVDRLQGREAYNDDAAFTRENRQRNLVSVGVDPRFAVAGVDSGARSEAAPHYAHLANVRRFEGPTTVQRMAAEMRALALYGPLELSTFAGTSTGRWPTRETLFAASSPDRRAEDPWFGFDKVQHFTFSFLWTLGTQYVAVNKGRLSESQALPLSISTSAAIGLTKEIYDLHAGPRRTFSYRDLVANSIGIVLAAGLILL